MIGVIERVKNNVLMKCSNLNDNFINNDLENILNRSIYQFAESLSNLIIDFNILTEVEIRNATEKCLKVPIIKKVKRKLFIDSLALQITNDSYIENYVNRKIDINDISSNYIDELNTNKKSNQLNMTEDLDLTEIMQALIIEVDTSITSKVQENEFVVNAINDLLRKAKEDLESKLSNLISGLDNNYLNILIDELKTEVVFEDNVKDTTDRKEGEDHTMMENINDYGFDLNQESELEVKEEPIREESSDRGFTKYDDMTLYNKMILGLNTKEEKLLRCEKKLSEKRAQIEKLLEETNKKIEKNIERENKLSQRKIELNSREKDLNTRLSEAEVIFLNMRPLIKGLNNIRAVEEGGDIND